MMLNKLTTHTENGFKYDLNNVCTNPNIVFSTSKKDAQKWDYIAIFISKYKGNWFYGFKDTSKGLKCSLENSCYKTKENAIKVAISELKSNLINKKTFSNNTKSYLKELIKWESERNNLTLLKESEIISFTKLQLAFS